MPHMVIEYSRGVEDRYSIDLVMQIAFDSGVNTGEMAAENIKVRAQAYDYYRMNSKNHSFLHVTVFLLAGRTDAQKEKISLLLRENLQNYLRTVSSISIDIRDMNTTAYKKRVL